MYEAEVNSAFESIETLPPEIRQRFAEFRDQIVGRTVLPWGEHCTECVWPTCYTTCELYTPRIDGNCRQFIDGMVRIDHSDGLSPYLLKLRFKPWAKLWTVGNLQLQPLARATALERVNIAVGAIGRNAPVPSAVKPRVLHKINYLRRRSAETAQPSENAPDCFLLECYNPNAHQIALTLTVRTAYSREQVFQQMIGLPPGYTRTRIAVSEMFRCIDLTRPFEVELVPNGSDDTVLYFGLLDFVKERATAASHRHAAPAAKWKCIVWDLDNTLWDGTLVEDGPENVRLRHALVDVIRQLDQRGVLHSIASKNNHDEAMKLLQAHGLDQYFLYPQIHWQPKSQSIARIAQLLNIGVDTIAFIDDQPFERAEVKAGFPQVAVIDAAASADLLSRPECDVPVTAEASSRRAMYREQEQRQAAQEAASGDYVAFLRSCQMTMSLWPLDEANLKRVYELAQRTNQLNFTGNRYTEAQLVSIMASGDLETHVIECHDRFGNYGIVGFAIVNAREPRLLDLMFSCRIQGKRVEHAVLSFLLKRCGAGQRDFHANYRKTAKNSPGAKVFDEMGFEPAGELDGVSSLVFRSGRQIADDQIISIQTSTGQVTEPDLPVFQAAVGATGSKERVQ